MGRSSAGTTTRTGAAASSTTGAAAGSGSGGSGGSVPSSPTQALTGRRSVYAQAASLTDDRAVSIIRSVSSDNGIGGRSASIPAVRQALRQNGVRSRQAQDMVLQRLSRKDRGDMSGAVETIKMSRRQLGQMYYDRGTFSNGNAIPMVSFNLWD